MGFAGLTILFSLCCCWRRKRDRCGGKFFKFSSEIRLPQKLCAENRCVKLYITKNTLLKVQLQSNELHADAVKSKIFARNMVMRENL